MKKPTPEDHIIQRARHWRTTEQAMISAAPEHKGTAQSAHFDAKKKLREAISYAEKADSSPTSTD